MGVGGLVEGGGLKCHSNVELFPPAADALGRQPEVMLTPVIRCCTFTLFARNGERFLELDGSGFLLEMDGSGQLSTF